MVAVVHRRLGPNSKTLAELHKAIDFFGTGAELARKIGVSRQLVYDWTGEKYAVSLRCAMLIDKVSRGKIKAKNLVPEKLP